MTSQGWAAAVGRGVIVLLWCLAGYLVLHYAVLLFVGPQRLHAALGTDIYNSLLPMGGFNLLLLLALLVVVWGAPLALVAACAAWLLARVRSRSSRRFRLATAICMGVSVTASLPAVLLDGWPGPLWALVFGDDTEFAPGYTTFGYWRIRKGMTADEVLRCAGEPLERYTITRVAGQEGWRWTRSPHDSSYRVRVAIFRNGRVVEKVSEFYVD